jgi:ankyrin repeat protein
MPKSSSNAQNSGELSPLVATRRLPSASGEGALARLPATANLENLKNQAKSLLKSLRAGHPDAAARFKKSHPQYSDLSIAQILGTAAKLAHAQFVIAREYGFASWPRLKQHVEALTPIPKEIVERFRQAVDGGDVKALRRLFAEDERAKSLVNDPIFSFESPALVAVAGRHNRELIDTLLDTGADPNARSAWWAGSFGALDSTDSETTDYLVTRGAHLDIHAAARLGRLDAVREMIAADPELVNARGGDGMTPLHFASTIPVCEFLLDHGAGIDITDFDHNGTPAQTAIKDREKLRYLVDRGATADIFIACVLGDMDLTRRILDADPDALSLRIGRPPYTAPGDHIYVYTIGYTARPIALAHAHGHADLVDFLVKRLTDKDRLLFACACGDRTVAEDLVKRKPKLIASLTPDDQGILADAAWNNKIDAVRLMLDLGFDINVSSVHNSTPLDRAALRGFAGIVRLLLERGASRDVRNEFGGTPFRACLWGSENWHDGLGDYPACIEAFLDAGEPVPEKASGSPAVAALLRERGAV